MEIDTARLDAMGIPLRFQSVTLDNYVAETDGQRAALKWAMEFAAGFQTNSRSALLVGKPGTGKTHLGIGIAMETLKSPCAARFCEATVSYVYFEPVLYISVSDAIQRVKNSWNEAGESESQVRESMTKPRLLILDEIGIQFGTDFERNFLFDIIDKRYLDMKPTILISNKTLEGVTDYLGPRVIDRLREDGLDLIAFGWESHRGKKT